MPRETRSRTLRKSKGRRQKSKEALPSLERSASTGYFVAFEFFLLTFAFCLLTFYVTGTARRAARASIDAERSIAEAV